MCSSKRLSVAKKCFSLKKQSTATVVSLKKCDDFESITFAQLFAYNRYKFKEVIESNSIKYIQV